MPQRTCSIDGCEKPRMAREWCGTHYHRWYRSGDPEALHRFIGHAGCVVHGCTEPHRSKGYCVRHYNEDLYRGRVCWADGCDGVAKVKGLCIKHNARMREHGQLDLPPRVSRAKPRMRDGYVTLFLPKHPLAPANGRVLEHRLVMSTHLGRLLFPDEIVHHKNGIKDDNRIENLELCVSRQPPGQRVTDLLPWARELVERYDGQLFPNEEGETLVDRD